MLDTGAVEALAPTDERRRARLLTLRRDATRFVLPAAVLAEGVLTGHPGRDHQIRRLLELVDVEDVDATAGYAAGALRHTAIRTGMEPTPSAVDAIVVTVADRHATHDDVWIVTSDGDDIEMLAGCAEHTERMTVLVV